MPENGKEALIQTALDRQADRLERTLRDRYGPADSCWKRQRNLITVPAVVRVGGFVDDMIARKQFKYIAGHVALVFLPKWFDVLLFVAEQARAEFQKTFEEVQDQGRTECDKINRPEDVRFIQNVLRGTIPRIPLESRTRGGNEFPIQD